MLIEKLKYYKDVSNLTYEQISEKSKTPLSTVKNIFLGKCEPLATTLRRISTALNVSLDDLLDDTNVIIAPPSLVEVKAAVEVAEAQIEVVEAKNDILESKVAALEKEIALLKMELQHKDELLAVHKQYLAIIKSNIKE